MTIPWWEHREKGVTGTDRRTDRWTDRWTDRQTERQRQTKRQTVIFFKGKSIWKCYLRNVGHFFRPKYGLIWCLFFIKVYHQLKLKREIVHISKFQNKILYQSKKLPDTFSTSSKCLQDPKWKSWLCSTIFIISYQTLAQCMCQSSTPIHYMYNLHNILYKISLQFKIETMWWTEKKDIQ